MKKWIVILFAIALMVFLLVNGIQMQSRKVDDERKWYVEQLHYDFSGEIDSIQLLNAKIGRVLFHFTRDSIDRSQEDNLNTKLKHNGNLRFLIPKTEGKMILISRNADRLAPGDSLIINTDMNKITVFRKGMKIDENEVTSSMNGRPF